MTELQRSMFNASPETLGDFGERIWTNLLVSAGYGVVPLHKIACERFKGPRQLGSNLVLPDFEGSWERKRFYIDAKCKKHRAVYRNAGNERRHGIDRKYWEAYSTLSAKHAQRAMLGIVELFGDHGTEEWSGRILAQTLSKLGHPVAQCGNPSREFRDIVFWPADKFVQLGLPRTAEALRDIGNGKGLPGNDVADVLWTLIEPPELIQTQLF